MQRFFLLVATVAFVSLPAGLALAQGTPKSETLGAPPAATPPAATTTTTPAAAAPDTAAPETAKAKKKKPAAKKMTRQQEIDKSIDSGTVPARYRRSVPKEYQQYVPFDKR